MSSRTSNRGTNLVEPSRENKNGLNIDCSDPLPERLTVSHRLLQLKQTLLVLVLLHDHTSHFRTREVAHGCGQRGLKQEIYAHYWVTWLPAIHHWYIIISTEQYCCTSHARYSWSMFENNVFLHQDSQIGGFPVLFVIYLNHGEQSYRNSSSFNSAIITNIAFPDNINM